MRNQDSSCYCVYCRKVGGSCNFKNCPLKKATAKYPKTCKMVAGFPGYFVSPDGVIYSDRDRISCQQKGFIALKSVKNFEGYMIVSLYKDKKRYQRKVHRLVAIAYLSNPFNYPIVRHRNGDKAINHKKNLVWGRPCDNSRDMVLHGRSLKGEKNASAKLNAQKVRYIRWAVSRSVGYKKIMERFDISKGHISNIIARRVWTHI